MAGDLGEFAAAQLEYRFSGALDLANAITELDFPVELYETLTGQVKLDHATLTPLYFLTKEYKEFELLVAGFSDLSLREQFRYGKALGKIFKDHKKREPGQIHAEEF